MSNQKSVMISPKSLDNSISQILNSPNAKASTEDIMDLLKLMKTEANMRQDTQNENFSKLVGEMSMITTKLNEQVQVNINVENKLNNLNNRCNGIEILTERIESLERRLTDQENKRPATVVNNDPNKVYKIELRNFPNDVTPDVTMQNWGMTVVVNTTNLVQIKLLQDKTLELYCTSGRTKYLIATWLKSNLANLQSLNVGFMPGFLKWIQSEDVKTFEVHNAAKNTIWSHDFKAASGSLN